MRGAAGALAVVTVCAVAIAPAVPARAASPRWTVVFGNTGMSVAVAPRVIFRRKTPRALGRWASSVSVLPSTALLVT